MSNEKELITKLSNIVAKQQKIITKLAQAIQAPSDLKDRVQADIIDFLYGKGSTMIPGKSYPQVHYAKVQSITPKNNGETGTPAAGVSGTGPLSLVVGLTIPQSVRAKWDSTKESLARMLSAKYSSPNQKLTSLVWNDQ